MRRGANSLDERKVARVEHVCDAGCMQQRVLFRARRGEHGRAASARDLYGGKADAAGSSMNEHRLARLHARGGVERIVRGQECDRDCGGLLEAHAFRLLGNER